MTRSRFGRRRIASTVVASLACLALLASSASAAPRSQHGEAGGIPFQILLPDGYGGGSLRYPVLYLIAGSGEDEDSAIRLLQLEEYAARRDAIIVTPVEGANANTNLFVDWVDGSTRSDSRFVDRVIPFIDRHYRTLRGREHRAIAGYSAGGYSSLAIASRHPDRFVTAAAFSGLVDLTDRDPVGELTIEAPNFLIDSTPAHLFQRFGNPYTHPILWHSQNPRDLASNLRGMRSLYIAAGDGTPADAAEVQEDGPGLPIQSFVENQIGSMTRNEHRALEAAGVRHTYRPHAGTHNPRHWLEDLKIWWPMMVKAFGAAAPHTFDYRSAAAEFSVWGWRFRADRGRATEFMDVTDASRAGVTLSGSGRPRVRTARLFAPSQKVRLDGAGRRVARANRDGRITFRVTLGEANPQEQRDATPAANRGLTRHVQFATARRGRRS